MMKDKLEKTGHRKRYYQFRHFVMAFLIALGALAVSAIPVGISIRLAEAEAAAAYVETSSSIPEEGEAEEPLSLPLEGE